MTWLILIAIRFHRHFWRPQICFNWPMSEMHAVIIYKPNSIRATVWALEISLISMAVSTCWTMQTLIPNSISRKHTLLIFLPLFSLFQIYHAFSIFSLSLAEFAVRWFNTTSFLFDIGTIGIVSEKWSLDSCIGGKSLWIGYQLDSVWRTRKTQIFASATWTRTPSASFPRLFDVTRRERAVDERSQCERFYHRSS